jgi:ligand-binding sensor domain-containing protein
MKLFTRKFSCLFFLLVSVCLLPAFLPIAAQAQLPALGQWRVQIPYNNPIAVQDGGDEMLVANALSVYRYAKTDGSITRLSKVNLLSDIGVQSLFAHPQDDVAIIAYTNSNVDVLRDQQVFNFPFIRNQNIVGDKSIYQVGFSGDSAYLACGFGIVVLDLVREQSPATYFFTNSSGSPIRVNDVALFGDWIFAATAAGLYQASRSDGLLEDFSRWTLIGSSSGLPAGEVDQLFLYEDRLHALADDVLYAFDGSGWLPWYDAGEWTIRHVSSRGAELLLTEFLGSVTGPDSTRIRVLQSESLAQTLQGDFLSLPMQAVRDAAGDLWIADLIRGLLRYRSEADVLTINPDGPLTSQVFSLISGLGNVVVAPGSVNGSWNKLFNRDGFFQLTEFGWNNINQFNTPGMDSVTDILAAVIDPNTGTTWLGSFGDGLLEYKSDGSLTIYKQNSALQGAVGDFNSYRVAGVALDPRNGNLWMANNGAARSVVVRTRNNEWYNFPSGLPASAGEGLVQCVVDDFGKVWYATIRSGGILVYDPGSDIASSADDRKKNLGLGAGNGNLPTTQVLCLAKDLDGEIWVGTEEGVAVFYNPSATLEPGTAGDAAQIIVELDGFPAVLLEDEFVRVIAIDGANRKWIGTDNGAFLLSEDGLEQLQHFTTLNSPLPDNRILAITVNGQTGEVFFGTDKGIISYRGEATEGGTVHEDVYVFPNPVREDYDGPIAIRGLVQDADVRITDVDGRMVYATTALGGQAIWDGRRVDNGERAATGVYLVFSSDPFGVEKLVTRFLMVRGN